jgi:hypothetical protein
MRAETRKAIEVSIALQSAKRSGDTHLPGSRARELGVETEFKGLQAHSENTIWAAR